MDVYGVPPPDYFRIDDLLDLPNDEIFSSSNPHHLPPPLVTPPSSFDPSAFSSSSDFTDHLSLPSDDVAELEWLSRFVDDSFADFPNNSLAGTINVRSDVAFSTKARTKRSRGGAVSSVESKSPAVEKLKSKKESARALSPMMAEGEVRRCTHCASEKTPQWRTGPLGPKTLCNACGVRYKSGRLVPEYRPAASPTFVLTQHSNSHRKVMELRRQKEMQQQQQQEENRRHLYHRHQDFEVC